jgi:hypothetical protein
MLKKTQVELQKARKEAKLLSSQKENLLLAFGNERRKRREDQMQALAHIQSVMQTLHLARPEACIQMLSRYRMMTRCRLRILAFLTAPLTLFSAQEVNALTSKLLEAARHEQVLLNESLVVENAHREWHSKIEKHNGLAFENNQYTETNRNVVRRGSDEMISKGNSVRQVRMYHLQAGMLL